MSEPMSSGEIEDVLSSIRRLVSEDLRPAVPKPADPSPVLPQSSGKLLLTPAFRVVGGAESAPAPMRSAPPQAEAARPQADEGPFSEDAEAAEIEDVLPENSEAYTEEVNAAPIHSTEEEEDWLPEEAPMEADHDLPEWETPKAAQKSGAAAQLNRVVSEIGAAVVDDADEWEPETGDMPVSSLSWKAPEWVEEAEVVADSVEAAERDAVARALADKAEAAAVAEIMARAAAAKAEAAAKAAAQPAEEAREESKSEPEADLFAEDEGYFDETVLRDLVRDLIREELSGTLGERITRNVRKLVRAEINRALTARDFD